MAEPASDARVIHPVLGVSRINGDTSTCSKCGGTIPEEHVPLLLWDDSGHVMWAYCGDCDTPIFALIRRGAA